MQIYCVRFLIISVKPQRNTIRAQRLKNLKNLLSSLPFVLHHGGRHGVNLTLPWSFLHHWAPSFSTNQRATGEAARRRDWVFASAPSHFSSIGMVFRATQNQHSTRTCLLWWSVDSLVRQQPIEIPVTGLTVKEKKRQSLQFLFLLASPRFVGPPRCIHIIESMLNFNITARDKQNCLLISFHCLNFVTFYFRNPERTMEQGSWLGEGESAV